MLKKLKEQPEFTLSVCISAGLFILLIISVTASGGFNLPDESGGWLYEYQTLIAGFVAGSSIIFAWHKHKNEKKQKPFLRART